MGWWRRLMGLAVAAASVVGAACHGYLAEPKARNVVMNSNYCPHCLAAGGPGVTYAGGKTWPNSKHGVCGDPAAGPLDHEPGGKFYNGGKVVATYVRGQRITLRVKITAPHGGRFSFGLCPVPEGGAAAEKTAVTQACFDQNRLKSAEGGGEHWWLGKKGTGEYTMDFILPPAITCKRCVLQWHYETGNSCNIPGTPPQHVVSPNMVSCDKSPNMEEFWNCADVSIQDGPGGPPAKPSGASKKGASSKGAVRRREGFANGEAALVTTGDVVTIVGVAVGTAVIAVLVVPPALALAIGALVLALYGAWVALRRMGQGHRGTGGTEGTWRALGPSEGPFMLPRPAAMPTMVPTRNLPSHRRTRCKFFVAPQ